MAASENLDAGTYEVLRGRLRGAADDLRQRIGNLNDARADVFGNIETRLIETLRVTTEHNCVARDLVAVGKRFLFGYNVQFGLKTETHLQDVFAAYRFSDHQFHVESLGELFSDPRFDRDFQELYRFYKGTFFSRFFTVGPFLHLVFRVGKTPADIKTFKFRMSVGDSEQPLEYIDNRSEHEVRYPPQHEFEWIRTTRDLHRYGTHPHIAIEDRLFVECVGGDLTIKVEDNTESGRGIYAEPVENKDQTLDDAEIFYAPLGNLILLKIRPYLESGFRYLVFNAKINTVLRIDAIAQACVLLPDDHGVIYPGGYYLQNGESKQFDHGLTDMLYERTLAASNGEDYLYLFYGRHAGTFIQLRYNVIRQEVDTPQICSGQAFFEAGEMVCFRGQEDPQKHHAIQIWQTPFVGSDYVPDTNTDSLLYKIGNKELVKAMAECSEILALIDKDDSYDGLYVDLVKKSGDILDSYFWLGKSETCELAKPLATIRDAATAAVEEFEKVVRVRRDTDAKTQATEQAVTDLVKQIDRARFEVIDDFVKNLAALREQRGHAIGLRDLRYVDSDRVEKMESLLAEKADRLSRRCVDFLLTEDALDPYKHRAEELSARVAQVGTVAEGKRLDAEINEAAGHLELLVETVSNLQIDDATKRTEIIDRIGDCLATLNRVRSALKSRVTDLVGVEGRAEFASQLKLMDQTSSGYLEVSDSPEKCDEYLTKMMVQLEEMEGRFAEFDEFVTRLTEKREELYNAFETKKVQLVEARNRRAETLGSAADRILAGIATRVRRIESLDAIHAYFASDLMVEKVRGIIDQLTELDDAVRVEDLRSRLKTSREDAIRQLKDRQELFEDGGEAIRLGPHRFAVNTQPVDLTTVLRDGVMCLHLTGTQFFEPLDHPDLEAARDLWDQDLISENQSVYRSEFLAVSLFDAGLGRDEAQQQVREAAGRRLNEGYAKGVHDHDATMILQALWELEARIGVLRHPPAVRAAGRLWWDHLIADPLRKDFADWIGGFAELAKTFPGARPATEFRSRLADAIRTHWENRELADSFPAVAPPEIARYLFDELVSGQKLPIVSRRAHRLYEQFEASLPEVDRRNLLKQAIASESKSPERTYVLAKNWSTAFIQSYRDDDSLDPAIRYVDELAWLILRGGCDSLRVVDAKVAVRLQGLAGAHSRIQSGNLDLHYHELLDRVHQYQVNVIPRFEALRAAKKQAVERGRREMRVDEFKPKVLSSFVRNRLIDEVYLPLVGDNLAKQIGVAGEGKRVDRMGLLLLVSPPGYGKTTLMEYIANRLGLVFVKINGPALGHDVKSLDPNEAPNASARQEIVRLNMALEMGDNVMLYLDDIQHTNPELLQKFISLCDATRKIEGVWKGNSKTYDLRGRRVAVVMAGNPYTESGDRFQIPDMLSNRADTYNLGETIGTAAEAFEVSYLENCLTSNSALSPLAAGSPKDARALIRAANRDSLEGIDLEGSWAMDQIREMFAVMKKLIVVRDAVLKVNRQYIRSAAQADAYRTEPPFKLQGSYRNMNRMAERVVSVMNDDELQSLIASSYEQDAQTLTSDNEANLLKFKELMGTLTPTDTERWEAIKYAYVENARMAGVDPTDSVGQLMRQLQAMRDGLESIRRAMQQAIATRGDNDASERIADHLLRLSGVISDQRDLVGEAMKQTVDGLHQIVHQSAERPIDQKVIVQHKMPRVVLDVVRGQFHLIQEWLRPMLEQTNGNGKQVERLRQSIDQVLVNYKDLKESLEDTKSKSAE
jgi:uncharacterized protein YeeX (DUF496 family)